MLAANACTATEEQTCLFPASILFRNFHLDDRMQTKNSFSTALGVSQQGNQLCFYNANLFFRVPTGACWNMICW